MLRLLWPTDRSTRYVASSSQLAYAVKEALDTNALKGGSVQALLAGLGCSYAHACRVFHKSFGLTPVAYITAQRLERAKSLLGNTRSRWPRWVTKAASRTPAIFASASARVPD